MTDPRYMWRALELAEQGRGVTSPNPMVGSVIVHDDKIIGEGYHQAYGQPHAEVNAVASVPDHKCHLLRESTMYVTLEPCAHYGKTPPCADLLVEKQLGKVVIACRDPFSAVDGKGIDRLRQAGIPVQVGMLEQEAIRLNARFFTFVQKKRPYVILKWAQTHDGFVARENFDSKWISNGYSRQLVHKWRSEEDAILVGKHTALHDHPSLTTRDWVGKNPIRILLDSQLEVPETTALFDNEAQTLIFNTNKEGGDGSTSWVKQDSLDPTHILGQLHKRGIQSLIVEGGAATLNSFITSNCWDEARVFTASHSFGKGVLAPSLKTKPNYSEQILDDHLTIYTNTHG